MPTKRREQQHDEGSYKLLIILFASFFSYKLPLTYESVKSFTFLASAAFFCHHNQEMNLPRATDSNEEHVAHASNHEGVADERDRQAERHDHSTAEQPPIAMATSYDSDDCEVARGEQSEDKQLKR